MANQGADLETSPYRIGFPEKLEEREHVLWRQRADALRSGRKETERPTVGFGLSGGGIRSATFCLGIFQALANRDLLKNIDYLSSVSGGGFFASLYGRMFAREYVGDVEEIGKILSSNQADSLKLPPNPAEGEKKPGRNWRSGVIRWLRENGRYLAPNGGGDLLTGVTVFLRNWITVQVIVAIAILAILLVAQLLRSWLPEVRTSSGFMWWSPYIYVGAFAALFGVLPLGWAYWAFPKWEAETKQKRDEESGSKEPTGFTKKLLMAAEFGIQGSRALVGLAAVLAAAGIAILVVEGAAWFSSTLIAAAAVVALTFFWWQFALAWAEQEKASRTWITFALAILLLCASALAGLFGSVTLLVAGLAMLAAAALSFWCSVLPADANEAINQSELARNLLSRWLRTILFATLAVAALAALDSAGQMFYALCFSGRLNPRYWLPPLFAAVASIVPFAQSIVAFLNSRKKGRSVSLSLSAIAAAAAVIILLPALISLDALSHAAAYSFAAPSDAPAALKALYTPSNQPKVAESCQSPSSQPPEFMKKVRRRTTYVELWEWIHSKPNGCRGRRLPLCFLVLTVFFSIVIGILDLRSSWVFVNRSSLHPLYCARLVRAYLGASNKNRYGDAAAVTDSVAGDDISQEDYWRSAPESFWKKGAPLHLVNVTINETVDGRSQIEQRDRKGLAMAMGPAGVSVGVQHHVVFTGATTQTSDGYLTPVDIYPKAGFTVFSTAENHDRFYGQKLSLGSWTAISGAAVATGLGSIGSIWTSLLTGFFNLRLGCWWDSGTPSINPSSKTLFSGARLSSVLGKWMAWALPIQSSLLDEFLGRFHGTIRRYWYLTDGGHFENLAGYELIRRRLPLIVIVDGAADVDYQFADLANLVRKARLDFNAEIDFINPENADGSQNAEFDEGLAFIKSYFAELNRDVIGTLDQLRRGKWASEPVKERKAFFKSSNEAGLSLRHAALAKVHYPDDQTPESWLLFIKPTLTGCEPDDVIHYHASHPDFPQETTADQFFDEAQWESYRKLGEYIGKALLLPVAPTPVVNGAIP